MPTIEPMTPVLQARRATDREWPGGPASRRTLGIVAGAAVGAAVLVPVERVGAGWTAAAVVVAGAIFLLGRDRVRPGWLLLGVALATSGLVRDAVWLFVLCALAAVVCFSLSVAGGRSATAIGWGSIAVWSAGFLALPWLASGARQAARERRGGPRVGWAALVGVALVVVFGALFSAADAAFAEVIESVTPEVSGVDGSALVVFGMALLLVGGAGYLVTAPQTEVRATPLLRRVRLVEWALPVGTLLGLFGVFIAVQVAVLFGGDGYVSRTAGVTYAEYARSGFWQLLIVTGLTLAVIGVAARIAPTDTPVQRGWLRGLLGGLTVATLVIVASAVQRLWLYQETYGFTVLRLLVGLAELWLGVVCLLVIAAGVRLRAPWLPRAVLGSGLAALLGLVALNPEGFVAQWNVDRYAQTQRIDRLYLGRLSADAVPALTALPEPMRGCVLAQHAVPEDKALEWNWSRAIARDLVGGTCG